jgi:hypothetical protein
MEICHISSRLARLVFMYDMDEQLLSLSNNFALTEIASRLQEKSVGFQ